MLIGDVRVDSRYYGLSLARPEHIANASIEPEHDVQVVVADTKQFAGAVAKYGKRVPVIRAEPDKAELRTLYEVKIGVAEWSGNTKRAEEIRAQRDGIDFRGLELDAETSKAR